MPRRTKRKDALAELREKFQRTDRRGRRVALDHVDIVDHMIHRCAPEELRECFEAMDLDTRKAFLDTMDDASPLKPYIVDMMLTHLPRDLPPGATQDFLPNWNTHHATIQAANKALMSPADCVRCNSQ